jgi:hypothetical protein
MLVPMSSPYPILVATVVGCTLGAMPAPHAAAAGPPASAAVQPAPGLGDLITGIARDNLPHEFESKKNWGHTTTIWSGLSVWREGLRIKTRGQKREANHGTWELYKIRLVDPQQRFHVQVDKLRELPAGRVGFDAWIEAHLDAYGQWVQWERGVQLFSVSAEADAHVRLRATCDIGWKLAPGKIPPDVLLDPVVTDAQLELLDFRLRRISDLHGPVVKELGRALHEILDDKLDDQRAKLVAQINRQIDKNRNALRLSLHDLMASRFGEVAAKHLPDSPPGQ